MSKITSRKFLKIGEAAKVLGVSIQTLRRWDASGKLAPITTPGGTRLYARDQLQKFVPLVRPDKLPEARNPLSTVSEVAEATASPVKLRTESAAEKSIRTLTSPPVYPQESPPKPPAPPFILRKIHLVPAALAAAILFFTSGLNIYINTYEKNNPSFRSSFSGILTDRENNSIEGENSLAAVLAETTAADTLEINVDTTINGNTIIDGNADVTGTLTAGNFETGTLTLTAPSKQIILGTGKQITLPDADTTLVGIDTTQTLTNKSMSGSSNTFTNIPNSALANSKVTITAGTNLSGGGDVSLGGSVSLGISSSPTFSTLTVSGLSTLGSATISGTLGIGGNASLSAGLFFDNTVPVIATTQMQSLTLGDANTGNIQFYNDTNYIDSAGNLYLSGSLVASGGMVGFWQRALGALAPTTVADDVLIGGATVGTAKIILKGTDVNYTGLILPYGASLNYVLTTDGSGHASWTNPSGPGASYGGWTLTGSTVYSNQTTYNVLIGSTDITNSTSKLRVMSDLGTSPIASFSGTTSFAGMVVDNSGLGDIFTASASGLNRFVITNAGNVGIGTAAPSAILQISSALTGTNYLDISQSGSSLFTVSDTAITANLPTSFTAAGDVAIAYDLVLTNPTAGYLKSFAPLAIESGENFNSSDLTLRTYNKGSVVIDSEAFQTLYAATISGKLAVGTTSATPNFGQMYVTNSATTGKALLMLNSNESADLFAASASGTTRFVITSAGGVGINVPTIPIGALSVRAINGTQSVATISGNTSFASLVVDNSGNGDIFTASASGLNRFVITNAGNVGIGITAPGSALQVNGAAAVGYSTATTGPTNGLAVSGNVGIGTTSPDYKLRVHNAGGQSDIAISTNVNLGSANSTQLSFASDYDGTVSYATIGQFNTGDLRFSAAGNLISPGMTLHTSGTVGIGTTVPSATLDVRGNSGITPVASVSGTTAMAAMVVNNNFDSGDIFTASSSGLNRFVITNAGNVGIGTTSPGTLLDLYKNANSQAAVNIYNSNAGSSAFSSFTATEDNNTACIQTSYYSSGGGGTTLLNIASSGSIRTGSGATGGLSIFTQALAPIRFGTGGSLLTDERMRIDSNGNVGIGTTVPTATLDVRGNSGITPVASVSGTTAMAAMIVNNNFNSGDIFTASASGLNRFVITNAGNVGIGTTGPGALLTVATNDSKDEVHIGDDVWSVNDNATRLNLGNTNGNSFIRLGQSATALGSVGWIYNATENSTYLKIQSGPSTNLGLVLQSDGGNVGIGTTAPQTKLEIDGGDLLIRPMTSYPTVTGKGVWMRYDTVAGADTGSLGSYDWGSATYRGFDIDGSSVSINAYSSGNVGIGTTAPAQVLDVNGRIRMATWTADGDAAAYRDAATDAIALVTSDQRLKKDIVPLTTTPTGALDIITQLNTYKYHDLDDVEGDKLRVGLMAQEVIPLIPELTYSFSREGSPETYYSVHYDKLPVLLLEAIKEQQLQITSLSGGATVSAQLNELTADVSGLLADNAQIKLQMASISAEMASVSARLAKAEVDISGSKADIADILATGSSNLLNSLILADIDVATISANFANFNESLKVVGTTQLADTSIGGSLTVGLLHFDDLKAEISGLTGLVTINSNLSVMGDATVSGQLKTKGIVLPDTATGEDYCVQVTNGEIVKKKGDCQ